MPGEDASIDSQSSQVPAWTLVVALVLVGLWVTGSPANKRLRGRVRRYATTQHPRGRGRRQCGSRSVDPRSRATRGRVTRFATRIVVFRLDSHRDDSAAALRRVFGGRQQMTDGTET